MHAEPLQARFVTRRLSTTWTRFDFGLSGPIIPTRIFQFSTPRVPPCRVQDRSSSPGRGAEIVVPRRPLSTVGRSSLKNLTDTGVRRHLNRVEQLVAFDGHIKVWSHWLSFTDAFSHPHEQLSNVERKPRWFRQTAARLGRPIGYKTFEGRLRSGRPRGGREPRPHVGVREPSHAPSAGVFPYSSCLRHRAYAGVCGHPFGESSHSS